MKTNYILLAMLLLLMGLLPIIDASAQSVKNRELDEAKKAIKESNDLYFQSFAKNDSTIFIDRYAEDCCIMLPNAPAMCGKDAPGKFFRVSYDEFKLRSGKFTTTEVYGLGQGYVVEEGLWESYGSGNKLLDNGKFLVLWKKTPKGWKMFRDSFSSNK